MNARSQHRRLRGAWVTTAVLAWALAACAVQAQPLSPAGPGRVCEDAITTAEQRYGLPPGLLLAISLAESGRADPATGQVHPWPWAVQADNRSLYFETRDEALAWVRAAQARGIATIDVGCMQIDLFYHPTAFSSLEAAFEPAANADYAARFLRQLRALSTDWGQAIGFYHSRSPDLAGPYRRRVERLAGMPVISSPVAVALSRHSLAEDLAHAWSATMHDAEPANGHIWGSSTRLAATTRPFAGSTRLLRFARLDRSAFATPTVAR